MYCMFKCDQIIVCFDLQLFVYVFVSMYVLIMYSFFKIIYVYIFNYPKGSLIGNRIYSILFYFILMSGSSIARKFEYTMFHKLGKQCVILGYFMYLNDEEIAKLYFLRPKIQLQ